MTNLNLSLKAFSRQLVGKKVEQLRGQGKIPAVLYGHSIKPINLAVDYVAFEKLFRQAGESTLVDLIIDEKNSVKVLIQDYQADPSSNRFLHIDFHQVRMDEKIHTKISFKFIGESPAVKESAGILVTNLNALEVECLPGNLIHEIQVDLSSLKTFSDVIHVSDIQMPAGITVLTKADQTVVLVQEQRSEKELAELENRPEAKLPEEVTAEATEKKEEGEVEIKKDKEEKK